MINAGCERNSNGSAWDIPASVIFPDRNVTVDLYSG